MHTGFNGAGYGSVAGCGKISNELSDKMKAEVFYY
jgi:hypothetical protein